MNNKIKWLIAALVVFFGCIIVLGIGYAFRSQLCENGMTLACNVGVAQVEEPVTEEIPSNCSIENLHTMPDSTNMVFSADVSCPNGVESVTYSYQMINGARVDLPSLDAAHMNDGARVPLANLAVGQYQMYATVMETGANVAVTEAMDFKVETQTAATPEFTAEPSVTPSPTFTSTPTHLPFGQVIVTADKSEISLGESVTLTVVLTGDVVCTWSDGTTVISGATKVITPTEAGPHRYGFSPDAESKCEDSNGINITSSVSVTVNPAAVVTATATPTTGGSTSSNVTVSGNTISGTIPGGTWSVSNVPEKTTPWRVFSAGDQWGATKTLEGMENVLRDPGVLTTEDCTDTNVSATCSLRDEIQETLDVNVTYEFQLPEASEQGFGYNMVTCKYCTIVMPDGVEITVSADEVTGWIIYVGGPLNADANTPNDGNLKVIMPKDTFNPGFTTWTLLPPGQGISVDYTMQNVAAGMDHECGNDGCPRMALLSYLSADQSVSVVYFEEADMNVHPVFTNWK